ncbi:hypothetical protein [Flavobacterium sp. ZS1P14]|uniref:hypothetical protein n=1 Tax=Flavobacterium sp. ZS1P14 TaxID=3401729 RepID=UPI003AAAB71E
MSCSEDTKTHDVIANQETSMKIGFTSKKTNLTGKNVKRGVLPITVDFINITSTGLNGLTIDYPFNIVPNETVDASDDFIIKNFQTGVISLKVVNYLKGGNTGNNYREIMVSDDRSISVIFNDYDKRAPIMFYSSVNKQITAVAGENEPVVFELIPENGRILSMFELSQELKDLNYTAKIEGGMDGALNYHISAIVSNLNNVINEESGGHVVESRNGWINKYKVSIYNDKSELVMVYEIPYTVVKGESVNAIYTITSDKIPSTNQLPSTIIVPLFKSDNPTNIKV